MIYLACKKECTCFIPFLQNFQWLLNKNNIDAVITHEIEQNDDIWFIIWNGFTILPKKCIIYNMDPMLDHLYNELKTIIKNSPNTLILQIVNYCYGKCFDKITELGFPSSVMPYGYSDYHQYMKTQLAICQEKSIDILFYGNIHGRRIPLIQNLQKFASNRSYILQIHSNLYNESEKIKTIAQAKIIVSIASADTKLWDGNDLARSAQLLSTGNFVITEFIGDNIVENKMKAYVPHYSTEKDIFDLIDFYLLYPEKRYAMISKANIEFKCDFDLESSLLALLPHNILSSRAPHDFIFLKGLDSLNNDIKCVGKKSIDELKDICNNDPKCIGFNTLGFMKSKINLDNLQPSIYFLDNNDGLYIDLNKLATLS